MVVKEGLEKKLDRIREIGQEITKLTEESKLLREQVATMLPASNLGTVTEETPVKFIWHGTVVTVIKVKGGKDYTVLFEDLATLVVSADVGEGCNKP